MYSLRNATDETTRNGTTPFLFFTVWLRPVWTVPCCSLSGRDLSLFPPVVLLDQGVFPPPGTTLALLSVSSPPSGPLVFSCRVFDFGLVALADSLTVVFPPPPSGEPGPLDLVGLPLTFGAYQGPLGFLSAVGSVCPPPFLRLSPGVDSTTFHPPGRNTLPDPGRTLLLFSLRENCNLRLLPSLLCGSVSCVSGLRKLSVVGD